MAEETKKDTRKKRFGGLASALTKDTSNKNIELYDDKKDNREWFEGKEILYRKWTKKMDIEYDSDPENKQEKDGKNHKHTAWLMNILYAKSSIAVKDKDTGGACIYAVNTIKVKLPPRTDENTQEPPVNVNTIRYDKYGYTRDGYRKKRADASDIPKDLK
eukprot:85772_1